MKEKIKIKILLLLPILAIVTSCEEFSTPYFQSDIDYMCALYPNGNKIEVEYFVNYGDGNGNILVIDTISNDNTFKVFTIQGFNYHQDKADFQNISNYDASVFSFRRIEGSNPYYVIDKAYLSVNDAQLGRLDQLSFDNVYLEYSLADMIEFISTQHTSNLYQIIDDTISEISFMDASSDETKSCLNIVI